MTPSSYQDTGAQNTRSGLWARQPVRAKLVLESPSRGASFPNPVSRMAPLSQQAALGQWMTESFGRRHRPALNLPLCALTGVLAVGIGLGVQPIRAGGPKRQQNQASPVEKAVILDVAALDQRGEPVSDLSASDFQIFDNGKRQEVVFFHPNFPQNRAPAALGPHEYSNRSAVATPPATVILFDLMNERLLTNAASRNEIVQSLQGLESSEDLYFYILANTGNLIPIHPLPNAETGAANDPHWAQQIQPRLDDVLRKIWGFRPVDDRDPGLRLTATVQALSVFGGQMAALPGRKNLVWITHGVPTVIPDISGLPVDVSSEIKRLGTTLGREHIAVYSVDESVQGAAANVGTLSADALQQVSDLTGGRYYSSGSIGEAIRQAGLDTRASYMVGYFPPRQNWNGKLHRIRISGTRSGIRLRAKEGYYAYPGEASGPQDQAIWMAASSPFDSPEIGLRAETGKSGSTSGSMLLELRVNAADVLLRPRGDLSEGDLLLALFPYSTGSPGQSYGFISRQDQQPTAVPIHLSFTPEQRDKVMQEGIRITQKLDPTETMRGVKLLVLDQNSGEYGSLSVPIGAEH